MLGERAAAYAAILLTCFVGLVSYGRFDHDARAAAKGDALKYIAMSEQPSLPWTTPSRCAC